MMEYEYLTDEELEQLISDVETEGLMMAPPGLMDDVMEQIKPRKMSRRKASRMILT